MTPKEKAKELVDKFARLDGYDDSIDLSKCEFEKQCALIAVDEMLRVLDYPSAQYTYYLAVNIEIEKGIN